MKLVYIASPLHASTEEEMAQNRKNAEEYCHQAMNLSTFSSKLIVPISPILNFQYIDENNPKERQKALNMGLALLSKCDELWVAGDRVSEGMRGELRAAVRMDIPIFSMGMDNEKIQEAIGELQPVFTSESCIKGSDEDNYEGKLLVLKPEALAEWCREPENQLWICKHGNGARFRAHGQSVFVENLMDGDMGRWDRHNFYGVADPEKLPEWAVEKLNTLQKEQENNYEMEDEI